jgi:hypothetical protein
MTRTQLVAYPIGTRPEALWAKNEAGPRPLIAGGSEEAGQADKGLSSLGWEASNARVPLLFTAGC